MKEHDQRFKTLLREFFLAFLVLFFPARAARLDLSSVRWHDTEFIPDPPHGELLTVDLLAEVRCRTGPGEKASPDAVRLFHLEVESRDAVAQFRPRMYGYYNPIRSRHRKPLIPIAVYLRVGLRGVGEDTYVETVDGLDVNTFRFLYVGLPGRDAEQYLVGDNWLGVALSALMGAARDRKAVICAEALRRIVVECPESPYRKHLLFECVEAYSDLDEEQRQTYRQLLESERYREVKVVTSTSFEKGVAHGLRQAILWQLELRFGPLHPAAQKRLDEWPAERLHDLFVAAVTAPSLKDLGLEE